MGQDTAQDSAGLFGYDAGATTFGLRAKDGIAYFGKAGAGRIVIKGDSSIIYGGACSPKNITDKPIPKSNGMIICLTKPENDSRAAAI